jgi:hypothetical protein
MARWQDEIAELAVEATVERESVSKQRMKENMEETKAGGLKRTWAELDTWSLFGELSSKQRRKETRKQRRCEQTPLLPFVAKRRERSGSCASPVHYSLLKMMIQPWFPFRR